MKITQIDAPKCHGGESPLWDPESEALFYIDNVGCKVHRYDSRLNSSRTYETPAPVTAIAMRKNGGMVLNLRTGICAMNVDSGVLDVWIPALDPPPFVFNDGKVDRQGRFILGASTANFRDPTPDGGLYSLGASRRLLVLDTGVHFSNGPCWSPDNKTLYFSDSWLNTMYAYDYAIASGDVSNKRNFINTEHLGGRPDGATVDSEGRIWVAIYGAGIIAVYLPDGTLERTLPVPVKLCSSVMFGGPKLDQLFVTTISHSITGDKMEEQAGYLFRIDDLGVRGIAEPAYEG